MVVKNARRITFFREIHFLSYNLVSGHKENYLRNFFRECKTSFLLRP